MILTAHPLQRIGAYALACLADDERSDRPDAPWSPPDPTALDQAGFDTAVAAMTNDAVRAALRRDTKKPEAFFLKSTLSLFPNSKMNHPSNGKRSDQEITKRIENWRSQAADDRVPADGAVCALCSQPALGFYGKTDVPLAESDAYRNTTPRGHQGMALCWSCLCCFHALPYGSRLTGGPCQALHSWDERFLVSTVAKQVAVTRRVIEIGAAAQNQLPTREVLALRALRRYEHRLTAGVELLVFGNNNRGPTLEAYPLDQAMAEWLRRTSRLARLRRGFRMLLHAHRSPKDPGYVRLARAVFGSPERLPGTCARFLNAALGGLRHDIDDLAALAALCFDYADKVMLMDTTDLEEIRTTGRRIATLFDERTTAGRLREFRTKFKTPKTLRSWLHRESVEWVLKADHDGPLVTTRGFELLFDPDFDNQAWFHQQMLLIAVVEALAARGWRPTEGEDDPEDDQPERPELDREDDEFVADGGVEDER